MLFVVVSWGLVAGAPERHRPAQPAGGAREAQAQEEAPRPVPQLLLHGTRLCPFLASCVMERCKSPVICGRWTVPASSDWGPDLIVFALWFVFHVCRMSSARAVSACKASWSLVHFFPFVTQLQLRELPAAWLIRV